MFSIGVLLVSRHLRSTHFHADCIIEGNLALAPIDDYELAGIYLGPKSWVVMLSMLIVCLAFITLCYKELKLMLFEPLLARRFGFKPALLQLIWLAIVSMTAVAAFNVAGAVLVVALMIAPPAAAYLLSDRLSGLLIIASVIAVISSIAGVYLGLALNISHTGPIASTAGAVFLLIFAVAPKRGFIAVWARRWKQRRDTVDCLVLDAISRQNRGEELPAHGVENLGLPLGMIRRTMARLEQRQLIHRTKDDCTLTDDGAAFLATHIG